MWRIWTAAAFIYVLAFVGPAHAFTTAEDFLDRQQDTNVNINTGDNTGIPRDSVTTCSGGMCVNRSIRPDPTECPPGQSLIVMFKYGNRSTICR